MEPPPRPEDPGPVQVGDDQDRPTAGPSSAAMPLTALMMLRAARWRYAWKMAEMMTRSGVSLEWACRN